MDLGYRRCDSQNGQAGLVAPVTSPSLLLWAPGASWAVIPEVSGWLAPQSPDLYRHQPRRAALDAGRVRTVLPESVLGLDRLTTEPTR